MATTLIALGANLGERRDNLRRAMELLDCAPSTRVVARSRWFSTAPIGGPAGQGQFVNAAVRAETSLSPYQLLALLRDVETSLGRQRRERWAARSADLDLLLFDDLVLKSEELEVPHPRMAFRRFVLEPAADVAADMMHPVIGWTIGQLLSHLNTAADYVALTGVPGAGKTKLAQRVAAETASRFMADPAEASPSPEVSLAQALATEQSRWCQRAAMLLRRRWTAESSAAISDFWLGQSRAYSQLWQGGHPGVDLAADCGISDAEVVQPKLLVLLDQPVVPKRWEAVRTELRRLVFHRGRGPMLQLDASKPDGALVELRAAIEAMR